MGLFYHIFYFFVFLSSSIKYANCKGLFLQPIVAENNYGSGKGFSYHLSLKEMLENCVAKIKVSGTLDSDYALLMNNSLTEGRLDIIILLLQEKAKKFCTRFEENILSDFLKDIISATQTMSKYFKESIVTGIKNNVLNVLKDVLTKDDYKEFESELYKVKKLYNSAKLDNYYKNFYGKNHKLIDSLIYDNVDKKKISKLIKEFENKLEKDPRQDELRQFIINLYSIKHGKFEKNDISENDTSNEETEYFTTKKYNNENNEKEKNIDIIRISNSLRLE
uniref:Uncharacterized protein n=1 Tax=Strongyloides venezuelensis TaxID=75913 RepID=A0A0K0F7Y5_STRVS